MRFTQPWNRLVIPFVFCILVSVQLLAQEKEPNSIAEKELPKNVLAEFKKRQSATPNVKWYPYPYEYGKSHEVTPVFYPVGWKGYAPDYYEARFIDEKGKVRMVFHRTGQWQITSRPLEKQDMPAAINSQLIDKGYGDWERLKIELISKSGETGKYVKIWLQKEKKKRILYFDESSNLVKTLKWDDDTNFVVDGKARFKTAPGSSRQKAVISDNVPQKVRNKVRSDYKDVNIIEWYVNERLYDPFNSGPGGMDYYDISAIVYYQVLFTQNKVRYIATYSSLGELLEVGEIIKTNKLPKPVLTTMENKYSSWKLAKVHDKVEMRDGTFLYKVYGINGDEMDMVILDANGQEAAF